MNRLLKNKNKEKSRDSTEKLFSKSKQEFYSYGKNIFSPNKIFAKFFEIKAQFQKLS